MDQQNQDTNQCLRPYDPCFEVTAILQSCNSHMHNKCANSLHVDFIRELPTHVSGE